MDKEKSAKSKSGESIKIEDNTPIPEAIRLAVQFYKAGRRQGAIQWCEYVLKKQPDNDQIRIFVGGMYLDEKDSNKAIEHLEQAVELAPKSVEGLYLLGNSYRLASKNKEAVEVYKKVIEIQPSHSEARLNLGNALKNQGKPEEAEQAYRELLEIDPNNAQVHANLGSLLKVLDKKDQSLEMLRQSVALNPQSDTAWKILGDQCIAARQWDEAIRAFEKHLEIVPTDKMYLGNLAKAYYGKKEYDKAIECLYRGIRESGNPVAMKRQLADLYMNTEANEKADELYREIEQYFRHDGGFYNNHSLVLANSGKHDEAAASIKKALELSPNNAAGYNNAGVLMMQMSRVDESISYLKKAVELDLKHAANHSNLLFYLSYVNAPNEEIYKEHLRFNELHIKKNIPDHVEFDNDREVNRKLRIGYVSPDFCGHVVTYFIDAPLKHHDKDKFEIFLYANIDKEDGVTARLKGYGHHWRDIHGLDNEEIVEIIKGDEIDILVDLAGHTAGNKLPVFAYRPAPVQATWIGDPNTTGVETIDYRIVDEVTDPEGVADAWHSEKLVRLKGGFNCYTPPAVNVSVSKAPIEHNNYVTFGSFNNLTKVIPDVIKVWAEVLKAVPDSRLLIKAKSLASQGTKDLFRERFEYCGVDPSRLILMGLVPNYDSHIKLYSHIDIVLDAFPFNGATTSCEALWMGCPIITKLGERHSSRVTASLIDRIGLTDVLVGEDNDGFVQKAAALAADKEKIIELRATIRDKFMSSKATDAVGHTREVEEVYRQWWQKWSADNPA